MIGFYSIGDNKRKMIMNYKQLFLDRWKELENQIQLERDEDGEIISTSFLKNHVFYNITRTFSWILSLER